MPASVRAGLWHIPLEKGIGNQNTGVLLDPDPAKGQEQECSVTMAVDGGEKPCWEIQKNVSVKLSRKKMSRAQSPFRAGECNVHSYGVLCIKGSALAFLPLFIFTPILCMGKLRHVEVFVLSLGSCVEGVTVEGVDWKPWFLLHVLLEEHEPLRCQRGAIHPSPVICDSQLRGISSCSRTLPVLTAVQLHFSCLINVSFPGC